MALVPDRGRRLLPRRLCARVVLHLGRRHAQKEKGQEYDDHGRRRDLCEKSKRAKEGALEEEVVALAIFGPNGTMDAHGRANSKVATLEAAQLRWLLDPRDSTRRNELMAVVKYIRPRGDREAVLRFDWRAQVRNYELRSACAPLHAPSSASVVGPAERLATHSPALCHSYKEKHVPQAAVREAARGLRGVGRSAVRGSATRSGARLRRF